MAQDFVFFTKLIIVPYCKLMWDAAQVYTSLWDASASVFLPLPVVVTFICGENEQMRLEVPMAVNITISVSPEMWRHDVW
jgi:hypothetical protein